VASISEDLDQGVLTPTLPRPGREGLQQLLDSKGVRFVQFSGWEQIDLKEKSLGSLKCKPREKITRWGELLKAADGDSVIKQ
ncbi:Pyridine nucleotide-disulfide oxidoreductase family protein, partial [Thalictrum thalictroides]